MSAASSAPRPGDVIAGKYRVERVLGKGGMGVVVKAYHEALDQPVALKFLLPEALAVPELVARFTREARSAAKIQGEHVARVIDVGVLPDGAPFMVMEFLDGVDLAAEVVRRGSLPADDAVDYVLQTCEALAQAHTLGIVHRDVKPQNMFLSRRPDGSMLVKILDFGISKVVVPGGTDSDMTKTSAMMGSPNFMSPEQLVSPRTIDARTDIWSLGVVLYKLLAGQPPFDGETMPELCARIMTIAPPPLRGYRPDLSPGLEAVVLRCLHKDRDQRYRDVAELARALAPYAPPRAVESVHRIARIMNGGRATGETMSHETGPTEIASLGSIPPQRASFPNVPHAQHAGHVAGTPSYAPQTAAMGPGAAYGYGPVPAHTPVTGPHLPPATQRLGTAMPGTLSGSVAGAGIPMKRGPTALVTVVAAAVVLLVGGGLVARRFLPPPFGASTARVAPAATTAAPPPTPPPGPPSIPPPEQPRATAASPASAAPTVPVTATAAGGASASPARSARPSSTHPAATSRPHTHPASGGATDELPSER